MKTCKRLLRANTVSKSQTVKCHKTYILSINQYITNYAISRENQTTHKLTHHKIKQKGNIYKINVYEDLSKHVVLLFVMEHVVNK